MQRLLIPLLLAGACGDVTSSKPDAGSLGDSRFDEPTRVSFTNMTSAGAVNTEVVAFQDGDGPWQVVTGENGLYSFSVKGPRFSIASACTVSGGGLSDVRLRYSTLTDGTSLVNDGGCAELAAPTVNVGGTVANLPVGAQFRASSGRSTSTTQPWTMPARPGPGTLLAFAEVSQRPTSIVLQPVNYAEASAFAIDFATGFVPAEMAFTPDPTANLQTFASWFRDPQGGVHRIDVPSEATGSYRAIPANLVGAGVSWLSASASAAGLERTLERAFKTPVAQTLTLPAAYALAASPQVVANAPYPVIEANLPLRAGATYYSLRYRSSESRTSLHRWELTVTAAWAGSSTGAELRLRLPDLSAAPGWKAEYALTAGATWEAAVYAAPPRFIPWNSLEPQLVDGEQLSSASASGTVR